MRKIISVLSAAAMLVQFPAVLAESNVKTIYLSANGADTNDGISAENALKSFSAAKSKVEEYKSAGAEKIKVVVDEGVYYTDSVLEIAGGSESCSVEYKAEGEVIISGAKRIDWNAFNLSEREDLPLQAIGKVYEADVGSLFLDFCEYPIGYYGQTSDNYYQLYQNDTEKTLARYPNKGYMNGEKVSGKDMSLKIPEDKAELWSGKDKINLNGYIAYDWAYARTYITNIDAKNSVIDVYNLGQILSLSSENKFFVCNLIEELDSEGEFYIDSEKKKLYCYLENEPTANDTFELTSAADNLINITNLKNVTISGFTFDKTRGRAVYGTNLENIKITDCTFKNIGRDAAYLSGKNIVVLQCEFSNVGARGVEICGGDEDTLTESGNIIEKCYFNAIGKTFRSYQGAVKLTGCGNVVKNNTMKDTPHQMIGYGGVLNKILFNDISKACTDSGDMGAIYAGRSVLRRANEIAYNYIHDIRSEHSSYFLVAGIYMDDGLCGQYIHHNIVKNVSEGIFLAGGSDNSVHDNIVIDCDSAVTLSQGNGKEDNSQTIFKAAVEYLKNNSLYKERFPTINYIDVEKTLARGNFIYDNLIVASGCKLYDDNISALLIGTGGRTNRRYNNIMVKEFSDFCDAENEDWRISEESGILNKIPGLAQISMAKIGADGTGGEYEYQPTVRAELAAAIESMDEKIEKEEYEIFDEVSECIAKAEVNGIVTDEFKNMQNYRKYSAMKTEWNTQTQYPAEISCNYGNIYTSEYNHEGGAGYSGSFYRPDFIKNLDWKKEWTEGMTENTMFSYNKYLQNNVKFNMKITDYRSKTLSGDCVLKNDSTYKDNDGEYITVNTAPGRYKSVEILANSDRPTQTSKIMGVRLDYADGSRDYSEYSLSFFTNGINSAGVGGVKSTKTWVNAQSIDELYDTSKRYSINGGITHYSVPADSTKQLLSVSFLNDKYDWKIDENGEYILDESGERVVCESEYSNRMDYKRTVTIYAVTFLSNEILKPAPNAYTAELSDIYYKSGESVDLANVNGDFCVKMNVSKNTDEEYEGKCIAGIYEDNRLVALSSTDLAQGEITVDFKNVSFGSGKREIKLFIWDSLEKMHPIMK